MYKLLYTNDKTVYVFEYVSVSMSRLMRTHAVFLQFLYLSHVKQRKALIQTIINDQLGALCEVALNVYRDSFGLSDTYIKKLQPYKLVIRSLISKRVGMKRKKDILLKRHDILLKASDGSRIGDLNEIRHDDESISRDGVQ